MGFEFQALNYSPVRVDFNDSAAELRIFVSPFSHVNIIATTAIIIITILNIIVYKLLQLHEDGTSQQLQEPKVDKIPMLSPLAPERLLCCFPLPAIVLATHNFDDSKVVGKGGFGKVYEGVIGCGGATTVAIKRLNHASKQGANEYHNEIEMLSKFRHHNLISLIGYCNDYDEMILVYEYMERGSLADHLYKIDKTVNNSPALSWVQRLKICIGAARGLEYLHTGTNVIHRDLKSSNILLDENLTAKVSDFGISRIGPTNRSSSHVSTKIKGTRGYVDPEYLLTCKLTKKSDVYSFGVVLFEVLSGRPVVDLTLPEEQWGLIFRAQHCVKEETIDKLIDPNLSCQILPNSLESFVKIANHCLHYRSKKRPTMAEVVASLESALALQERTDSSIFDHDLLILGANFGNQEIEDNSSEQAVQIDKNEQENEDYYAKQREIVRSGNVQHEYKTSADESRRNSRTKPTRITAFVKNVQKGFSNSRGKNKKSLISDKQNKKSLISDKLKDKLISMGLNELKIPSETISHENTLGYSVYKGILPSGQKYVVKRLIERGLENNESTLVTTLQHQNFVRMLGWCIRMGKIWMILEYMPNLSLDYHLFDPVKRAELDWTKRLTIIKGIVQGMLYLHQESRPSIILRYLNARSVLLDEEMNPKISNIGLARVSRDNRDELVTNSITGTSSYMAPEYVMEGRYSVKTDIYSFGVLLLHIVKGGRASMYYASPNYLSPIYYAWKLWFNGEVDKLIDPAIADSCPRDQVMRCIHVALSCVQASADYRPTISDVLMMLESENTTNFPLPVQESAISNLAQYALDPTSLNDLTVTEVDAR